MKLMQLTRLSAVAIIALAFLMISATAVSADEVYLDPATSSESYCNTTEVELWINASNFQGATVELTYNPDCAEVEDVVFNNADFDQNTNWNDDVDGRDILNVFASDEMTGEIMIATLTIHCESEEECTTDLVIDNDESMVFNGLGAEVAADFINGEFSCEATTGGNGEEPAEEAVYFDPATSSESYCNTTEVELWINASNFQGATVELTYNPDCAEVEDVVFNNADFDQNTNWNDDVDGRDILNVFASDEMTGEIMIATLTIHCESEEECTTDLVIDNDESMVFNGLGAEVAADFINGEFSCEATTGGNGEEPAEEAVYFDPATSSESYCNTTEVELWINASNFQGATVELTYNPDCAEVEDVVFNNADFDQNTNWNDAVAGKDVLNVYASDEMTGEIMIATLTIHCESEEDCTTDLVIDNDNSMVFNGLGQEVAVDFINGQFNCTEVVVDEPISAIRDIMPDPAEVGPCDEFNVSITVENDGQNVSVIETLPEGFEYVSSTVDPLMVTPNNGEVIFNLGNAVTEFEYTVKAVGVENGYMFDGVIKDEAMAEYPVEGESMVNVVLPEGVALQPGQSLISTPYTLDNSSVDYLFMNVDTGDLVISQWNCSAEMWEPVEEMVPMRGYAVWNTGECTQVISYDVFEATSEPNTAPPSMEICEGYNIVAAASADPVSAEIALSSIDESWNKIITWDTDANWFGLAGINGQTGDLPGNNVGEDEFMMHPFEAYYLTAEQDDNLTL